MNFKYLLLIVAWLAADLSASVMAQSSPTLTSLTPYNTHVGDTVVIAGTGFDPSTISNNQVYFITTLYILPTGTITRDSVTADVVSVTGTSLAVVVPTVSSGDRVSVLVNGQFATSPNGIHYNVVPTVSGFAPQQGSVGDTITITGTGFNAGPHAWFNNVWFTNGNNTTAFSSTPTTLKVVVPVNSTTGPITVFTNTPRITTTTIFTVLPSVDYISPTSGDVGTAVTFWGYGFDASQAGSYEVKFNGVTAPISDVNPVFITTHIPSHATTGPLTLTFKGDAVKGSGGIFFVNPTMPTIKSYSIDSGYVGDPVRIVGSGFDQPGPPLQVKFGNGKASIVRFTDDTIYTSVPPGATRGSISVTAAGIETTGFNLYFRVLQKITGLSSSRPRVGDTVVVRGMGFGAGTSTYYIQLPLSAATAFAVTDTTMKFTVPLEATAGIPRLQSTFYWGKLATLPYMAIVPTISSFEPDTVFMGRPNQVIDIYGTGFGAPSTQSAVAFSGGLPSKFNVLRVTATHLRAPVPKDVKPGPVSVFLDSLMANSKASLVVLPDTFPYKPAAPFVGAPDPVTQTSFTARWTKSYRATKYVVDVLTGNFTTYLPGFHSKIVTDTLQTVSGLSPGTNYKFFVRAVSGTDTSDYGGGLITTNPPNPVALPAVKMSATEFALFWRRARTANYYTVEATTDEFKNVITADIYGEGDTTAIVKIYQLDKVGFFSYRVKAHGQYGWSDYSNVVVVAVVTEASPNGAEIVVFPNPSADYVRIVGLNAPIIESVLFDEAGKSWRVSLATENGDTHTLDIRPLAKGTYVLRIGTGQSVIPIKFVKE